MHYYYALNKTGIFLLNQDRKRGFIFQQITADNTSN